MQCTALLNEGRVWISLALSKSQNLKMNKEKWFLVLPDKITSEENMGEGRFVSDMDEVCFAQNI